MTSQVRSERAHFFSFLFFYRNFRAAHRSDAQNVAGAAAKGPLDVHLELLEHVNRNECLDSACKSAAVDSARALAVEGVLSHVQRNGKALVLHVGRRVYVL